jgi:hypothetical protein
MYKILKVVFVVFTLFGGFAKYLCAAETAVYESIVDEPIEALYPLIVNTLNGSEYVIAHSINVSENYKRYENKWRGSNKFKITEVRSLIICNLKFSYAIRDMDPRMLGLCPMHLTLYESKGKTHILLNLPSYLAANSPAYELAAKEEKKLIKIIETDIVD